MKQNKQKPFTIILKVKSLIHALIYTQAYYSLKFKNKEFWIENVKKTTKYIQIKSDECK